MNTPKRDRTRIIANECGAQVFSWDHNSGGPNKGRNLGLEKATGDYICLLDQDDTWLPGKIEKQIEAIQRLDVPIVFTEFQSVDRATGKIYIRGSGSRIIQKQKKNELFKRALKRDSSNDGIGYLSSIMFHKSLKHVRFEEHFGKGDYDWLLQIFEGNETGKVCEVLVQRNVHGQNLSLNPEYRRTDYYYS